MFPFFFFNFSRSSSSLPLFSHHFAPDANNLQQDLVANTTVVNLDDDEAGVSIVYISGFVSEDGTAAVYNVTLTSMPSDTVTVPLASSNTNEGTVAPSSLVFSSANWNRPQSFAVTGVDDLVKDGDVDFEIQVWFFSLLLLCSRWREFCFEKGGGGWTR